MLEGIPSNVFKDYFKVFRTIHNTHEGKRAELAAAQSQSFAGPSLISAFYAEEVTLAK